MPSGAHKTCLISGKLFGVFFDFKLFGKNAGASRNASGASRNAFGASRNTSGASRNPLMARMKKNIENFRIKLKGEKNSSVLSTIKFLENLSIKKL